MPIILTIFILSRFCLTRTRTANYHQQPVQAFTAIPIFNNRIKGGFIGGLTSFMVDRIAAASIECTIVQCLHVSIIVAVGILGVTATTTEGRCVHRFNSRTLGTTGESSFLLLRSMPASIFPSAPVGTESLQLPAWLWWAPISRSLYTSTHWRASATLVSSACVYARDGIERQASFSGREEENRKENRGCAKACILAIRESSSSAVTQTRARAKNKSRGPGTRENCGSRVPPAVNRARLCSCGTFYALLVGR